MVFIECDEILEFYYTKLKIQMYQESKRRKYSLL
jgi:hypothetical protein